MSEKPPIHLDHVYILVTEDAPETEILQSYGLRPYTPDTFHSGQGTASRCCFFQNAYLELLWIHNVQEMRAHAEQTGLSTLDAASQWREIGASPFGIGFHYLENESQPLPLKSQRYEASWMPESSWTDTFPKASIYEPEYFIVSGKLAYRNLPDPFPPGNHPLGLRNITQVTITVINSNTLGPVSHFFSEHVTL
jgi:hypothetical protein